MAPPALAAASPPQLERPDLDHITIRVQPGSDCPMAALCALAGMMKDAGRARGGAGAAGAAGSPMRLYVDYEEKPRPTSGGQAAKREIRSVSEPSQARGGSNATGSVAISPASKDPAALPRSSLCAAPLRA
jgi:hypothetical protein